jgi:hypothetical protein
MESYQNGENEEGQELILPVVIDAGSIASIEDILRIIPRALIKYFDEEYSDDGLFPEQDFLEWLSDGGIVDLRIQNDTEYKEDQDQVTIECLGHTLIIEPVTLAEKIPRRILKLKKYFEEHRGINENTISLHTEAFKVPLASIVASPASHTSNEELLNQVCFAVSSIFFTLQEQEIKEWRDNDFRVEVFLEDDITINSNTRVLSTIEETGRIASTGFWID